MTEERLKALEGWAGYPDRDPQAARLVRELVREVRRLQSHITTVESQLLAEGECPAAMPPFDVQAAHADDDSPGVPADEVFAALLANAQPAPVPPGPFGGWECKVCSARPSTGPDNYGIVEHGKGCYTICDDGGGQELIDPVMPQEQPAPVPPFHGILDGITAEDVYGVHT